MSEKKKKQAGWLGTIPFVLLWALSYGLGWFALIGSIMLIRTFNPSFFSLFPEFVYFIPLGAIPGLISGSIQQVLIRWKFGIHIRRWWLGSTLGAILAAGAFFVVITNFGAVLDSFFAYLTQFSELLGPALIIGSFFALYSTAQAWVLREHVKRTWMWPLAAFVSAATFIMPLFTTGDVAELWTTTLFGIAGLLQGSVMGLTLVWLFGMTRVEPLKRGMNSTRLEEAEEKLADSDMVNDNVEHYSEEQFTRQKR